MKNVSASDTYISISLCHIYNPTIAINTIQLTLFCNGCHHKEQHFNLRFFWGNVCGKISDSCDWPRSGGVVSSPHPNRLLKHTHLFITQGAFPCWVVPPVVRRSIWWICHGEGQWLLFAFFGTVLFAGRGWCVLPAPIISWYGNYLEAALNFFPLVQKLCRVCSRFSRPR